MAPSASSIDYKVLKTILTTTIKSISDEAYAVDNYESIVGSYESFLLGVAQLSDRLNSAPLKAAGKHIFNCSAIEATKFSTQLVEAFKFCRSKMKGYQGTPGKEWHTSVSAVVHKMYTKPNLQSKKTNEDLSPKTSPRTSPTKSNSADQLLALGDRQVQLSNNYIVRYAQIQSNMYTSVSIYVRITKHACNFYSMHTSGACEGNFVQRVRCDDPIADQSTGKR